MTTDTRDELEGYVRRLEHRLDAMGHQQQALLARVEQLETARPTRPRVPLPYCCTACGEAFDLHPPPTVATPCPECGEYAVRRQVIPA
jgi:rubrerythrin